MLLPLDEAPVHVPLRRPRPLRFERLRVPVWNPYSRGRLGPAKSEDRKGGEGKTDANLTNFLLAPAAPRDPTCKLLNPHRQGDSEHAGDPRRRISPMPSWLCSRTDPCEMNRAREFTLAKLGEGAAPMLTLHG